MRPSHTTAPPRDDFRPSARERWIYAFGPALLAVMRQSWFRLLLRDAILFLALTLTVLGLDNSQAIWRLWWPMPLALAACLMTFLLHGVSPMRWRHMINLGLFALPLAGRVWLAYNSPVPNAGVHEAHALGLILFMGVALWFVASCHPTRALAVWLGAILTGGLAGWNMLERGLRVTGDDPFRLLTLFTLVWGAFSALFLLRGALGKRDGVLPPVAPARLFSLRNATIDLICLLCLGLGLVLGFYLFERQVNLPLSQAIPIQAGLNAQKELWLQSILFGWGGWLLERLIHVAGDPGLVVNPPWGGLPGSLARGGVAGIAVMLVWSLALNRQVRRKAVSAYAQALGLPSAMGVFLLIGLFIMGAPRSRLAALVLAGWVALALVKPIRVRFRKGRPLPPRIAPAIVLALLGAALMSALTLPTWGRFLAASSGRRAPSLTQQALFNAREFNPWDPAIPARLAASYKHEAELGDTPTDLTYLKVVRYYQEAQELDPYETAYPLQLANFQLQSDRQEEAIKTVSVALVRRPHAQDLMAWVFGTALRFNQNALADSILSRALAINPMDGAWWQNQYTLARRLGQGPLAAEALAVALTGALEDHQLLVNDAFEAMQGNPTLPVTAAAAPGEASAF